MATSQNGWPVASRADIHYYPVPGDTARNAGTIALRRGDVATVMLALLGDLQKIEPAKWPGMWGWYVRPIRGKSSGYSNHSSATAIDWNAPEHGRQDHSRYLGWSASQVKLIDHLLATKYKGLIRWGAHYNAASLPSPPATEFDPMHFEVIGSAAQIRALATEVTSAAKPQLTERKGKLMFIVSLKSSAAQYVSDGIYRRWIPAKPYRDQLIAKGCDPDVLEFDTVAGMNACAGPLAPGTTDAPEA